MSLVLFVRVPEAALSSLVDHRISHRSTVVAVMACSEARLRSVKALNVTIARKLANAPELLNKSLQLVSAGPTYIFAPVDLISGASAKLPT